jgi:RND family efflux transporter MFP subunit
LDLADLVELDWLVNRMNHRPMNHRPMNHCPVSYHLDRRMILLAALALAASTGGVGCDSHSPAEQPPAVAATRASITSAPAPATPSQTPLPQDAKSFSTTGPLVAEQQADIAAERNGRVVSIAVKIGDRVKQGQVLALLDDRVLRSTADSQKARIASAQAAVREWEAEESSARAGLRRADAMHADKIISEEDWEHAKYKLDETIAEVARYRNDETAAEADFTTANLQLEQSRIIAPFAGVVGRSSVRPAQEVKPGDVLFWITAEAPLQVLFTVPETAMAAFPVGAQLDLTTADYPTLHQRGRVERVSPVVDPASGSVQVIGGVVGRSPLLKPGMQMQVRLAP